MGETNARDGDRSLRPVTTVILCTLVNLLDGYDMFAIAFVAPHIAQGWGVTPASMGLVFASGVAGVGVGALFLAPLGDRVGRKPTVLYCLALVTIGMLASSMAASASQLALFRLLTGLGIGMAQPCINSLAAESVPAHRKGLAVSVYVTGYPIGAAISGSIALFMTDRFGWEAVFAMGGAASALLLPVSWLLLSESPGFVPSRRLRARAGFDGQPGFWISLARLLRNHAYPLVFISVAFFSLWFTIVFVANFVPIILGRSGLSVAEATRGGLFLTLGGIVGSVLFGLISTRIPLVRLTVTFFVATFLSALLFAYSGDDGTLMLASGLLGLLINGAVAGMFALAARAFPVPMRATGTGVAVAASRLGGLCGVSLGGILIGSGMAKFLYVSLLAIPLLVAAACVIALRRRLLDENGTTAAPDPPSEGLFSPKMGLAQDLPPRRI